MISKNSAKAYLLFKLVIYSWLYRSPFQSVKGCAPLQMLSFSHPHDHTLLPLPIDTYEQLAPALSVLGMATQHLYGLPTAVPVAQHITALTNLNATTVSDFAALATTEELQTVLATQPLRFYSYVTVGRLLLISPVAGAIQGYLQRQMQLSSAESESLFTYCLRLSGELENALERLLTGPSGAAALAPLRQRQQQLAALLVEHRASLVPPPPPLVTLGFDDGRLQMLRLALLLVQDLRHPGATHPFLQALPHLSGLPILAVETMSGRLAAIDAHERLGLTMPELVLLYQAMHVCALTFVSGVLGKLGMEGAFPVADITPSATASGSSRQAVATLVAGFIGWVEKEFGQTTEVQQARQEIKKLAALL